MVTKLKEVDVVVIGQGLTGVMMAKEMTMAGLSVVGLERGPDRRPEQENVLRVKGFVEVDGKPMRLLVQAVGPRVTTQYDRAWMPSEKRQTQLVVIGLKGLDRDKIVFAYVFAQLVRQFG